MTAENLDQSGRPDVRAEVLRPIIYYELLFAGYIGLNSRPLDQFIVANQQQFGKNEEDVQAMVRAHQNQDPYTTFVAMRKTVARQFEVTIGEEKVRAVEAEPEVTTTWIAWKDRRCYLMSPDEAQSTEYAGRTAYQWACRSGEFPERVVRTNSGLFFSAKAKDVIVTIDSNYPH